MDDGLYGRILAELHRAGTVRRLLVMLRNEPRLDRTFVERVRQAKATLGPRVHAGKVTNGAPLTPAAIEALDASGIDDVSASIDALQAGTS